MIKWQYSKGLEGIIKGNFFPSGRWKYGNMEILKGECYFFI